MMKQIVIFIWLAVCSLSIAGQAPIKKCPVCGLSISKCQYKGRHPNTSSTKPAQQQATPRAKPAKQTPTPQKATANTKTGMENGHEWVDLGLSVKWATCNLGAFSESGYGGRYAWGETSTKASYEASNYFDKGGDRAGESNWIYKQGGKEVITPTSGHDSAREIWGGAWRLPTASELEELRGECQWKWMNKNGHDGYLVTGPNGNSIFLPAAGYREKTFMRNEGSAGYYWTNAHSLSYETMALGLSFSSGKHEMDAQTRSYGRSVRPVTD